MRIIKLHTGLLRYLHTELKKPRKPNEWVRFLQALGKSYFQELIKHQRQFSKVYNHYKKDRKKQLIDFAKQFCQQEIKPVLRSLHA